MSGWSSPRLLVSASISSRLALDGSIIITGSPVRWSTTNTRVSTQNSTIRVCPSLARRKSRMQDQSGRSTIRDIVEDDALIAPRLVPHLVADRVDQLALEEEELGRLVVPDLGRLLVVAQPLRHVQRDARRLHQLVERSPFVVARPDLVEDAARAAEAPDHAVGVVGGARRIGEEQAREGVGAMDLAPPLGFGHPTLLASAHTL